MNEKHSVRSSAVQMVLPRNHFPLGKTEDSPVIKGELHQCNISKSLLAKWKKKRRGVERRQRDDSVSSESRGERRLKSKWL